MIILDATTKKLQALLAGAVAANQCPIVASYVDLTTTSFLSGQSDTATNNGTAVDIVAAPAASTQRQVKYLSLYNADTAAVVLTVRYNDNATLRTLVKVTLAVGSTLTYTDGEGWRVMTSAGIVLSGTASSLMQTSIVTLTNAQIKALPTTSIPLIVAPGVGYRNRVLDASIYLHGSAGAYTNIDATYASLWIGPAVTTYLTNDIANDSAVGLTKLATFLGGGDVFADLGVPYAVSIAGNAPSDVEYIQCGAFPALAALENQPVYVGLDNNGSGNLTGGNAANTMKATVYYTVEAV